MRTDGEREDRSGECANPKSSLLGCRSRSGTADTDAGRLLGIGTGERDRLRVGEQAMRQDSAMARGRSSGNRATARFAI